MRRPPLRPGPALVGATAASCAAAAAATVGDGFRLDLRGVVSWWGPCLAVPTPTGRHVPPTRPCHAFRPPSWLCLPCKHRLLRGPAQTATATSACKVRTLASANPGLSVRTWPAAPPSAKPWSHVLACWASGLLPAARGKWREVQGVLAGCPPGARHAVGVGTEGHGPAGGCAQVSWDGRGAQGLQGCVWGAPCCQHSVCCAHGGWVAGEAQAGGATGGGWQGAPRRSGGVGLGPRVAGAAARVFRHTLPPPKRRGETVTRGEKPD